MFKHGLDEHVSKRTAFNWFLLCFISGSVNAGGVMACHRFVTHVTGFATLAGIDLVKQNWHSALGLLSVPLYFLLGTVISAFFIDRRIHQGQTPHFAWVMALVSLCLGGVGVAGMLGYFGPFGGVVLIKQNYFLMVVLCLASGLQNAAITTASRYTVRTTHLTGTLTDFGIGLVRAFFRDNDEKRQQRAIRNNWLRLGNIVGFMIGSGVGALIFWHIQYVGFFVPAALAAFAVFQELVPEDYLHFERAAALIRESLGLKEES